MAKKNQTKTEQIDSDLEEDSRMTLDQARAIVNAPKGTHLPIVVAHATRRIDAEKRAAMDPVSRAKADFADLVNDAANRIVNGGRRTIAGACNRFSAVPREGPMAGKSLLSDAE